MYRLGPNSTYRRNAWVGFRLGIYSNCRRGAETARKSLAGTNTQVFGTHGQWAPNDGIPVQITHNVTNLRR
jgi:hypothetical protein